MSFYCLHLSPGSLSDGNLNLLLALVPLVYVLDLFPLESHLPPRWKEISNVEAGSAD
jgi:hypothetical protein